MIKRIALSFFLGLTLATFALGSIHTYQLQDHPDGNQNPPSYGLRLDNLLRDAGNAYYNDNRLGGVTTFSFEAPGANVMAEVNTANDTLRIFGTAVGGVAPGSTYTHQFTIDLDFTYQLTSGALTGFDANSPNVVMNQGGIFSSASGNLTVVSSTTDADFVAALNSPSESVFNLSAKADPSGNYFNFREKTLRGGNHGNGIEGEGWLLVNGQMFGTQDFLFTANLVPEPTGALIWTGLGLVGFCVRRRRQ